MKSGVAVITPILQAAVKTCPHEKIAVEVRGENLRLASCKSEICRWAT